MYCFYQLFLKPYPRQGSLTSKIKHFKCDSLPLSILGCSYFPVTALECILNLVLNWSAVIGLLRCSNSYSRMNPVFEAENAEYANSE